MSSCTARGRLGNSIIRFISTSIIAEKFNLFIIYDKKIEKEIKMLGVSLFKGINKHKKNKILHNKNFMNIYNENSINHNILSDDFLQSKTITSLLNSYLNSDKIRNKIIANNNFKNRYKNNNDCFVHIRLGDVAHKNPGFEYYDKKLSKLQFDKLYVSSDSIDSDIIKKLVKKYKNAVVYRSHKYNTILFGSTCKYVILSYGTFSACIGYFSFYSYVYPIPYIEEYSWDWGKDCDTCSDKYSLLGKWIYD